MQKQCTVDLWTAGYAGSRLTASARSPMDKPWTTLCVAHRLPTGRRLPTSSTVLKPIVIKSGKVKTKTPAPALAYSSPVAVQTTGTTALKGNPVRAESSIPGLPPQLSSASILPIFATGRVPGRRGKALSREPGDLPQRPSNHQWDGVSLAKGICMSAFLPAHACLPPARAAGAAVAAPRLLRTAPAQEPPRASSYPRQPRLCQRPRPDRP